METNCRALFFRVLCVAGGADANFHRGLNKKRKRNKNKIFPDRTVGATRAEVLNVTLSSGMIFRLQSMNYGWYQLALQIVPHLLDFICLILKNSSL